MSDAETYYQGLISRGYSEEKAEAYTKIHFSDFRESSNSGGIVTTDGNSNNNKQNKSSNQFLLSVLLSITAITLITVSIFLNSWMTGVETDDQYGFDFGLTGYYAYEIDVESDSMSGSYSELEVWGDEDQDAGSRAYLAGIIALVFLILGIVAAVTNLYLFVMENLDRSHSDYLRRFRFASSCLVFVGGIIWLALFPTSDMVEFTEINLDLGIGFYLALLGGIAGFLSAILQYGMKPSAISKVNVQSELVDSNLPVSYKSSSYQSINSTTMILTLIILPIAVIFISMFTNNWMVGTWEEEQTSNFGLHEETAEYDGESYILDYSYDECQENELCSELGTAGSTAFVMLQISIAVLVFAVVFIHFNTTGLYESSFGKIAALTGGAISVAATIVFYSKFPDLSKFDVDTSPGFSLFLVGLSGIVAIVVGLIEHKLQQLR